MNRVIYVLIFLVGVNLVITIYGFVNQPVSQPQIVYVSADKSDPATVMAPTVPTIAVKLPDEQILRNMIQAVLKQELAPYAHNLATVPEVTQKTSLNELPSVKENSPANIQAFNESTNVVDSAIARGIWTQDDTTLLLQQASNLTNSQKEKIAKKLVTAVNEQQLKLQGTLPAL